MSFGDIVICQYFVVVALERIVVVVIRRGLAVGFMVRKVCLSENAGGVEATIAPMFSGPQASSRPWLFGSELSRTRKCPPRYPSSSLSKRQGDKVVGSLLRCRLLGI